MVNNIGREAVILAGGLGTRLRSEVSDLPKCMAPVAGKPFVDHVILHLQNHGIEHIIFSLGFMAEVMIEHLMTAFGKEMQITMAVEDEPLGTGGAILYGAQFVEGEDYFALNGDSLFSMDPQRLQFTENEICIVGLKPMRNFERYGTVDLDKENYIISFHEKKAVAEGLINGGLYRIKKKAMEALVLPEKFSFEKDFLEVSCGQNALKGVIDDAYFIDIGIPEDFRKANIDLLPK